MPVPVQRRPRPAGMRQGRRLLERQVGSKRWDTCRSWTPFRESQLNVRRYRRVQRDAHTGCRTAVTLHRPDWLPGYRSIKYFYF